MKGGLGQCRTELQSTNFSLVGIQGQLSNLVMVIVISYQKGGKRSEGRILLLRPSPCCLPPVIPWPGALLTDVDLGMWSPCHQPLNLSSRGSHLQQGVPVSSRITGPERLIDSITFYSVSPQVHGLETKCRMLSQTNNPPLSLFDKYILLLIKCKDLYMSVV